jgi:hypothetical protein
MKISTTKDYKLFCRVAANRTLALAKHKKLRESMEKHGFLPEFPIVCTRDATGRLTVKDGQHRLAFAHDLGLPVYWVEATSTWDVAEINTTLKTWVLLDYAEMFSGRGLSAYAEVLEFSKTHGISIGISVALLSGKCATHHDGIRGFVKGTFIVRDRAYADRVAGIYGPFIRADKRLRNTRFLEACMAVCMVKDFDPARLLRSLEKCCEKLRPYSTREAYLDMLEEMYNFGRKMVSLRVAALTLLRHRKETFGGRNQRRHLTQIPPSGKP